MVFLALVTLHVLIAENQFHLDQLQQQASAQQERYEKLRLEVAELEAPARIVSAAEGPLGLRQPGSVTYLAATPTTATPTSGVAGAGTDAGPAAPQGDADWPLIKPYLSGTP
jgi:cell division protein FtsL